MKDKINMMIGSELFYGFYESMYCNTDEFVDDEMELESLLKESLGENVDFIVEYVYEDFKKYKYDVCKCFKEEYMEYIVDEMDTDEIDHFLFSSVDDTVKVYSPKYYNYTTDKCYWEIQTNYETLQWIKNHTLKMKGCKEYLLNHYTSCDGFISFISNDIEYWKKLDIREFEENMIIALLDMFLVLSDSEVRFKLNYDVYEKVCKYEYVYPVVYYEKKNYELDDFVKLMGISLEELYG